VNDLSIDVSQADGGPTVIALTGELDLAAADDLWGRIEPLLGRAGGQVVLECSRLSFMDSTGLRVVLRSLHRATEHGGSFAVAGLQPPVRRVFDLAGVSGAVPTYSSVEQAAEASPRPADPAS
jgi:stage II sporulation protein AA (anti-sigma F factor antagonist)